MHLNQTRLAHYAVISRRYMWFAQQPSFSSGPSAFPKTLQLLPVPLPDLLPSTSAFSFRFYVRWRLIVLVVDLFVSELCCFLPDVFSNIDWLSSEILHKAFPLSRASKPSLWRTQPSSRGVPVNCGRGAKPPGRLRAFRSALETWAKKE